MVLLLQCFQEELAAMSSGGIDHEAHLPELFKLQCTLASDALVPREIKRMPLPIVATSSSIMPRSRVLKGVDWGYSGACAGRFMELQEALARSSGIMGGYIRGLMICRDT